LRLPLFIALSRVFSFGGLLLLVAFAGLGFAVLCDARGAARDNASGLEQSVADIGAQSLKEAAMRILLVEGAHELGGQARHVFDLAKGLAERGYEVTVACARQEAIIRLDKVGIPCVKLPFGWLLDPVSTASLVRLNPHQQV
jgi:hypothetical protein